MEQEKEQQDVQVFAVYKEGNRITGSTTIQDLLAECRNVLPIDQVYVLDNSPDGLGMLPLGRIDIAFYPQDSNRPLITPPPVPQVVAPEPAPPASANGSVDIKLSAAELTPEQREELIAHLQERVRPLPPVKKTGRSLSSKPRSKAKAKAKKK